MPRKSSRNTVLCKEGAGAMLRWKRQKDHLCGGFIDPPFQPERSLTFISQPEALPSSLTQGATGFEAHIDKCLELAEYLYNIIKNREGYEMVFDGKVCLLISMILTCLVDYSSYH